MMILNEKNHLCWPPKCITFIPIPSPTVPRVKSYDIRTLCMVIKCHKAKNDGKRCTCSLPYPWDSPEENTLVRGMTGQPVAYEKNSMERKWKSNAITSPECALCHLHFSCALTAAENVAFDEERGGKHFIFCGEGPLWKQVSLTLRITHSLDWSFPTNQRRAVEVKMARHLPAPRRPIWIRVGSTRSSLYTPAVFEVLGTRTLLWVPSSYCHLTNKLVRAWGKAATDWIFSHLGKAAPAFSLDGKPVGIWGQSSRMLQSPRFLACSSATRHRVSRSGDWTNFRIPASPIYSIGNRRQQV